MFLGGRGHPHHTHGPRIAVDVTIQFEHQFTTVGLVGDDARVAGIELFGMYHVAEHSQRRELAVQMVSAWTGFIDHQHLVGQRQLLPHEFQKGGVGEALGRLG